nr:prolow-density lipoprotein receptor-related protein 1-like [Lytechinus pictus]
MAYLKEYVTDSILIFFPRQIKIEMDITRRFCIISLITVHLFVAPSSSTDKLFVADAHENGGSILMAETDGLSFVNSTFSTLPLTGLRQPIGVEYDPRTEMVYWTDAFLHTINRAVIDGSMQEVIAQLGQISIPEDFEYPFGIALNLDEDKVYWADQYGDRIEMADLDGSNREVLISTGFNTNAAGVAYSRIRRKIFWTEQGPEPKIEMANHDGTGRQVLVDSSQLVKPNGICLDSSESNLYWTDTDRDSLESINLDNMTTSIHFMINLDIHPFGIANYFEDLYFSDIITETVYLVDFPDRMLAQIDRALPSPVDIHIYSDTTCPGFNLCAATGTCVLTTRQPENKFVCVCRPGYTGIYCDEDINECDSAPCVHGSCSEPEVDSYDCTCQPGFTGLNCETNITYCDPSPCTNGATCTEESLGYTCECAEGFTGDTCSEEITCPLPNHPLSHVSQPQSTYMAGALITIECDEIDASVVWRCNGATGEWIQLADLDCQSDEQGLPISALIGIVAGALFVLLIGICLCFLYKFVNKRNRDLPLASDLHGNTNSAANLPMGAVGGMSYPCAESKILGLDDPIYDAPKDVLSNDYTSTYSTQIPRTSEGSRLGALPDTPKVDDLPPEYSVCDPTTSSGELATLAVGNMYESRIGYQRAPIDMTPSPMMAPKNLNHHYYEHRPRSEAKDKPNEYLVVQED